MKLVNRAVLVLKPTDKMLAWINAVGWNVSLDRK